MSYAHTSVMLSAVIRTSCVRCSVFASAIRSVDERDWRFSRRHDPPSSPCSGVLVYLTSLLIIYSNFNYQTLVWALVHRLGNSLKSLTWQFQAYVSDNAGDFNISNSLRKHFVCCGKYKWLMKWVSDHRISLYEYKLETTIKFMQ